MKNKKRKLKTTLLIVTLIFGILSCNKKEYSKQVTWDYKYEVTCDKSNDLFVRYIDLSGNEVNEKHAPSGWVYSWSSTFMVDENNNPVENAWMMGLRHLYVSGTNNNNDYTTITTRIWRNGVKIKEQIEKGSSVTCVSEGNF